MTTVSRMPQMAPWLNDFFKATADQKVTKAEVKTLIAPHKDQFDDATYRRSLEGLLSYEGRGDVKLTRYAKAELQSLLKKDEPQIWWPTNEQLTRVYGSIVNSAMQDGRAVRLEQAPEGIDGAPRYNITPEGLVGVNKQVFLVDGKLYLQVTSTCFPAPAQWFDCGPAPLF